MNGKNTAKQPGKTIDLVYTALGAVLIAICSWIAIPAAIPFTMQTFGVSFVLSVLGGRRGTTAILVYILLGAAGIPVFSQFSAGIGILLGSTGGYILGFLFMGLTYWLFTALIRGRDLPQILGLFFGLLVLYAFGTVWYMLLYTQTRESIGFITVLASCVFPFLIPDLLKLTLALSLSRRLAPALKRL